jgi:hypothetical protein
MISGMVIMDKDGKQILHDWLNMKMVCAKMVPKILIQEQKKININTFKLTPWNKSQSWMCLKMSPRDKT